MKKMIFVAGGFIALGALCFAGRLWADPQAAPTNQAPQAPARTRIALINLTFVIKNYHKYQHFQEEMKRIIAPFQAKEGELRKQADDLRKKYEDVVKNPQSPQKEEYEREAKEIQRKAEDNNAEAKRVLGTKSDDSMRILYLDVVDAAQRYATLHDFDLVLQYNDALNEQDYYGTNNIARKLNTGALMPLYAASGMDISKQVADVLNANVSPATPPSGAPAQGAAPAGNGHQ